MLDKPFVSSAGIAFSSLIMAMLVYYAGSKYGPGLTFDSINYVYAGYHLSENGTLMRPNQTPFVEWPPLYPSLIALLSFLPGTVLKNLFYFQIGIAALSVGLACTLAKQFISHPILRMAAYLGMAFSTPVLLVNHFVWSESVFSCLVVLQIHLFIIYIHKPGRYKWCLIILCGALLCLQRQVGAFFVAGGFCILLSYPKEYTRAKRLGNGLLYVLLASVGPLLFWWIRNYYARGIIMNDYRDTLFMLSLPAHWSVFNDVFTSWVLPGKIPAWIRIGIVYAVVLAVLSVYLRLKNNKIIHTPPVTILMYFVFSYLFLLFLVSFIVTEEMDDRKLAPVYIPGMVLFFHLLDTCLSYSQARTKILIGYACLVWTIYPIARALYNAHRWHYTPRPSQVAQPVDEAFLEKLRF